MLVKNFLREGNSKGDRTIWMVGAVALALFAFLAAGLIGDDQEPSPAESAKAVESREPEVKEGHDALEAALATPKKASWRTSKRKVTSPEGPGAGSIWGTIGALGLVLLLVFAAAVGCSRFLKKMRMRPQGNKVLELVDVIPLGPKKQVFIVSAYGRNIIVGATADSMSVLSEFSADEIEAVETDTPLNFSTKLSESMSRPRRNMAAMEVEA
ncbi:MAG: flagellar biogenesis protein FliO [Planctomycetota bacterium]|jgi:flagellar biogenesis protein FliO